MEPAPELTQVLAVSLAVLWLASRRDTRPTFVASPVTVAASSAAVLESVPPPPAAAGRFPEELVKMAESLRDTMAALAHSERRLNAAQRLAHVGSWEWDERLAQSTWSEELERIFGLAGAPPATFADCLQYVHPDDRAEVRSAVKRAYAEREPFRLGFRIVRPDGVVRVLQAHNEVVVDPDGTMRGFRAAVQDLTESARAEEALREGEARYRLLFENNPQPMWVYDRETLRFLAVNNAAIAHYGYSRDEFLAMDLLDIRPREDAAAVRLSVEQAPDTLSAPRVWRHRRKDGSLLDVEVSSHGTRFGSRDARLVLANDVTERRRLEEQLRQAQKMDAIGRLAGGVAHDFNNILGVILGYGQMVDRRLPEGDPLRQKTAEILKAGERAADLTRQLLTFSRKQVVQPKVLDLNLVVEDMDRMLRRLIGEDVALETRPGDDLGAVEADPGQMEQVILNLAVNARDAMPEGGSLVIETRNVELGASHLPSHPGARPGAHVMLAVRDTGCGMEPATAARIFEPFFTTKPQGKGTGLGLSTVYGIVTKAGGHIDVHSEPGRGTTFKVFLPRVYGGATVVASPAAEPPSPGGSETVLLVEDEPTFREVVRDVLEQSGYRVLANATAQDALALLETDATPIDLVLTDVVMPGMNGPDLVKVLASRIGLTRAVYMSGYTDDAIGHHGVLGPEVLFLQKPFTSAQLLRKVREAVVAEAPRGPAGIEARGH